MFRNKQGKVIDGGFFIRLFFFRDYIRQYQIIQESLECITINIVLKNNHQKKEALKDFIEINKAVNKVMESEMKIKYNFLEFIPPSPSGKYAYIMSKVNG